MSFRTSRILRFLLAAIASVAIAAAMIAVVELAFRVAGRLRSGRWPVTRAEAARRFVEKIGSAYEAHPYLVVRGRPGATIRVPGHEAHFDSLAYRGPEVASPKPSGRYRILCVGGSTTFDLLAADDRTTWPSILASQLGSSFDVVNAGFPGWTTVETLVSLQLRDLDTRPDLVLVFAGINDLQPASHRPFTSDYTRGHAEILRRVLGVDPIPIRLASRLVSIEWLLDRLGGPPRVEAHSPAWEWGGGARATDISPAAVAVFRRNLTSIIATAQASGAKVIVVAQRLRVRPRNPADREYIESWAPGFTADASVRALERFNEASREVASQAGATFVDPFAGGAFAESDFGDPMHFSPSGSSKFATTLLPFVRTIAAGSNAASGNGIK